MSVRASCGIGHGTCWDRSQARSAVGGGFPAPPFRLRGGITIPPWPNVSRGPPFHPGRSDFPSPVGDHDFHPQPSHCTALAQVLTHLHPRDSGSLQSSKRMHC
jgi:hypothetical protein